MANGPILGEVPPALDSGITWEGAVEAVAPAALIAATVFLIWVGAKMIVTSKGPFAKSQSSYSLAA